jgi:tetratricopeptide (TPR) repeat protein
MLKNLLKETKKVYKRKKKTDDAVEIKNDTSIASQGDIKTKELTKDDIKKIKIFDDISKYAVYVLIALLSIFFIPTPLVELGQAKIGLLVLTITVAIISLGISSIYKGGIKLVDKKIWIPMLSISLVTFISAFFSTTYQGSFMGFGNELDSWYLISIFFLTTLAVMSVVNTKEKVFTALSLFWVGFGLSAVFQIFRLLASAFNLDTMSWLLSLGGVFDLPALNTIGTWGDFGIVAGVSALSLAVVLDTVPLKNSIRNVSWFLFALSALMSFVASSILVGSGIDQLNNGSQFVIPSMFIIGLIALLFAIFQLIQKRKEKDLGSVKFPVANFILIVFGFILMVSPLGVNQIINHNLSVPNESVLNVRPGISDTYEVSKAVLSSSVKNFLIGSGPHGFYIEWNKYRPDYVNNLDLWNTDYQYGASFLLTLIVDNGLLGFLLWIISLIALFVFSGISICKSKNYTSIIIFVSALFLWINALINISGPAVMILTFLFTGLLLAKVSIDKIFKTKEYSFAGNIKSPAFASKVLPSNLSKNKLYIIVVILVSVVLISMAFVWIQRTRAQSYSVKSMQIIYAKNASISSVPTAMSLLQKAYSIHPSDVYARGINNLAIVQVNYDISSSPDNQDVEALRNGQAVSMSSSTIEYLKAAASSGRSSVENGGNDFRNFLQFGTTMQTIALLNLEKDAGSLAMQSFVQAANMVPNHPLPLYSLANLYILAGDRDSAKNTLGQVLKLKPNFSEANDLYQSILAEESAVVTASSTIIKATTTPAVKTKTPIKKTTKPAVIKKATTTTKAITTTKATTTVKSKTAPKVTAPKATTTSVKKTSN